MVIDVYWAEQLKYKEPPCDWRLMAKYNPEVMKEGYNTLSDGEEISFISNPALGLWAHKDRFEY